MSSVSRSIFENQKPTHYRWVISLILFVSIFFAYCDRVNVAILIADNEFLLDMGISGGVAKGMLMTSFLVTYGISNFLFGTLGDIFGPRKVMLFCIPIWTVAMFIGGLAQAYAVVIISRMLLGIGEGIHYPTQSKFVKEWFPPHERGRANALWSLGISLASGIAMPFFAWIIFHTSWRLSFFIMAVASMIPMFCFWVFSTDKPSQNRFVNDAEKKYINNELKKENDAEICEQESALFTGRLKHIFYNYEFWVLTIFYMANVSVFFGALTWLPSYLKEAMGFSWTTMGILASMPYFIGILAKIVAGYYTDKLGDKKSLILVIEMILSIIGVTVAANVGDASIAALFLIVGIGANGLGSPGTWTILQNININASVSTSAGIMSGIGKVASALAPIIIGYLISLTGNYVSGLYYIIGCCVVGLITASLMYIKRIG
jgi:sugar phosphate permease